MMMFNFLFHQRLITKMDGGHLKMANIQKLTSLQITDASLTVNVMLMSAVAIGQIWITEDACKEILPKWFKLQDQQHSLQLVHKNLQKMPNQRTHKMILLQVLLLKLVRNSPNFSMPRRVMLKPKLVMMIWLKMNKKLGTKNLRLLLQREMNSKVKWKHSWDMLKVNVMINAKLYLKNSSLLFQKRNMRTVLNPKMVLSAEKLTNWLKPKLQQWRVMAKI